MTVTDYPRYRHDLRTGFRELKQAVPDVMKGFGALHAAAVEDGVLSRRTKELIALAIGIAVRCDGCITLHVHAALEAGATRQEIEEAVGVAVLMGGGPAAVYGTDTLTALDQFEAERAVAT